MTWSRRTGLKAAAICLGAVVTIKVGPLAVLAAVATSGQLMRNPASTLWPALGLAGLAGFVPGASRCRRSSRWGC